MNVSIHFVLGSLLLLTPSLILIAALRLYFPIHRTISFLKQGILLPAAALVISVIINGSVFFDYIAWSRTHFPELWEDVRPGLIDALASVDQSAPWRPGSFLLRHLLNITPLNEHNVMGLVLDVHLRVLILTVAFVLVYHLLKLGSEVAAAKWYIHKARGQDASKFIAEKSERSVYNPWRYVQYVRDTVYHPWAILTSYNRHREILMVDVMCGEDLYSGMFTSWAPHGDEAASAIAMQYILRYYDEKEADGWRKQRFVENNGEMIFPMKEVANIHFWEIRIGAEILVTVKQKRDLEVAKWYLALNEVNPGKIAKLVLEILRNSRPRRSEIVRRLFRASPQRH